LPQDIEIERRLVAVLAADVAGFSRLTDRDEVGTLRMLAAQRAILDAAISRHRGRIANTAGDSVLAEFPSAVNAMQCAVEAQQALRDAAEGAPADQRVLFRIGIHVGVVMVRGGDLLGNGVNVAARLEALADAGGIVLSAATHEQVRRVLPLAYTDLGPQSVKNIEEPVRAFAIGGATVTSAASTLAEPARPLPLPDKPSIAVLPFQNMSGDPEQEYFADGMVEDIITALSRYKWLFVIARNSTFAYKGRSVDIRQVGRELGVRYVLEGSVRKASNRIRITAQLIDAETSAHIWADRYDRALDDIFAVQDEITLSTVAAIEPSLRQAEIERARRKRPENLDAYDLVLRATPLVDTGMPEGALEAVRLLERALLLEPNYALAHGQAAFCNEILYLRAGRQDDNRSAAIRHAHHALALGPDDAPALVYAAIAIGLVEHDRALALETFEAALAISPSAAWAYSWGSLILGWGGEAERAIEWGERGIRLSPLDPWITAALHGICMGHFLRGRYEDAAAAAQRAIRSKPGFSVSHMFLAAALAKLGRTRDAQAAAERVMQLQPNFSSNGQCSAIGCVPILAGPLIEAMRTSGLPE
jgi:adenylate cyclase